MRLEAEGFTNLHKNIDFRLKLRVFSKKFLHGSAREYKKFELLFFKEPWINKVWREQIAVSRSDPENSSWPYKFVMKLYKLGPKYLDPLCSVDSLKEKESIDCCLK